MTKPRGGAEEKAAGGVVGASGAEGEAAATRAESGANPDSDAAEGGVRVTDKRRIDPQTGSVRPGAAKSRRPASQPAGQPAGHPAAGEASSGAAQDERVAELTNDLQRITAEYANYRKRVERDRQAMTELAVAAVLAELLPILDDIERAREHGELTDGFRAVGDAIQAAVGKLGLERFGEAGDPFDPAIHEALAHSEDGDLDGPTCVEIYQPGYRFKGRVVRPARVIVKE